MYVLSRSVMSDSVTPNGLQPTRLLVGILQARIWSGLPFPSPGDHPNLGIQPTPPVLQVEANG